MSEVDEAKDGAEAVRRFAGVLNLLPDRILARLDGEDGMAGLCAVEAAMSDLWPPAIAKELVWLTRTAQAGRGLLRLQAYGADGEVLGDATFRLGLSHASA